MNRQIVVIAISLSLTLILVTCLISPKYQELKILERENKEKRAEIQERERHLEEVKKIAEELKNYQIKLAKIDSALPSDPGLPVLFDFLQKTSSQSGLVLKKISSSASQSSPNFEGVKETILDLVVSGSYSSFKNFLLVLEKTARLIEVESISFSSTEQGGSLEFNLKIKVYSY